MKKKNLKPMVISALLAVGFAATSVGTSFALFTDKAETSISVTSGLVDVKSVAKLVRYHSSVDNAEHVFGDTEVSYENTSIGTTFGLNGNTITIDKMVPGDELTFSLKAINKSNVKTKTRYTLAHALLGEKDDLFPALEIEYAMQGTSITNDQKGQIFRWKTNDPVAEAQLAEGKELHTILVTVKFPNDDNVIRAREEGENNKYQDAACSITFGLEAVQANAKTDPISEINAYLNAKAMMEGHNATMHDAVNDMNELGYTLDEFVDFGAYVWSIKDDQFVAEAQASTKQNEYFKVCDSMPQTQDYSIYAYNVNNSWTTASVELNGVGFDAGDVTGITSVSYINSGEAKTNIIRTNSLNTSVTVNAPNDVVKHYGDAQYVNIQAVAGSSYHEYGRVALVNVANGRIALEKDSDVDKVHFTATSDVFNAITVAYDKSVSLPDFSRDAVNNIPPGGKLVVKLEDDVDQNKAETDYIWLYQQGLVQQIRVSDEATSAGNVKATDEEVSVNTHKVADDIANVLDGDNNVVETGVKAENKESFIEEAVEDYLSRDDVRGSYKYRINGDYYETFEAAFNAVKENETIRILDDDNITRPKVGDSYTEYSITKNFTINIEEGVEADFGNTQNYYFMFASSTKNKTLTLEGNGSLIYTGTSYALIDMHSGAEGDKVVAKDLKVEATAPGNLSNVNLEIKSGFYKNVTFSNSTTIESGFFTNDVRAYVKEGKMCVESSLEGYNYVVDDLDEAHASYSVKKANNVTKYYSTFSEAISKCGSGDVFKILGEPSVINIDNGSNKFIANDGATYDLNGHTLNLVGSDSTAIYTSSDDHEITIKNGAFTTEVDPTKIVSDDSNINLIMENVSFENVYKESILQHCNNGYFIQDDVTSTIRTTEPSADAYTAKTTLDAESGKRSLYYFNCEHSVEQALKITTNGAYVEAKVNETNVALAANLHLNDRVTIALSGDATEYPSFKGGEGKAVKISETSGVATFEIQESYTFSVKVGSVTTSYKANEFASAMDAFVGNNNATFNLLDDFEYNLESGSYDNLFTIPAGTTGLQFLANGHKFYFGTNNYGNSALFKFQGNGSLTIDGGGLDGQIISQGRLVSCGGDFNATATFKNGYFECGSVFAYFRKSKNKALFQSGCFVAASGSGSDLNSVPQYEVSSGTIFGAASFNSNKQLILETSLVKGDSITVHNKSCHYAN